MTIKEEYRRQRRNYLSRVNRAVKSGYRPDVLPIPKRITQASIRALKKRTGEWIRSHSAQVAIETGEELKPTKNKKVRRQRERAYREYMQKPLQQVEEINVGHVPQPIQMSTETLDFNLSYEQIISNWYDNIRINFYWYIARFIESQTNRLIDGKDADTRKRFAYVLSQHPDVFPEPPYTTREEINKSFMEVAKLMELAPDSEAYHDFISMYDYVENENL